MQLRHDKMPRDGISQNTDKRQRNDRLAPTHNTLTLTFRLSTRHTQPSTPVVWTCVPVRMNPTDLLQKVFAAGLEHNDGR